MNTRISDKENKYFFFFLLHIITSLVWKEILKLAKNGFQNFLFASNFAEKIGLIYKKCWKLQKDP